MMSNLDNWGVEEFMSFKFVSDHRLLQHKNIPLPTDNAFLALIQKPKLWQRRMVIIRYVLITPNNNIILTSLK